ncbi:hypothetical protein [Larkinella terrae]|uniref:hypothetical protein n=1 Tax=Larkinella terrae TaxID=2025311 RepID=UPI001E36BBB1|nr:hypothetical protein [Larkinella terrae]
MAGHKSQANDSIDQKNHHPNDNNTESICKVNLNKVNRKITGYYKVTNSHVYGFYNTPTANNLNHNP